MSQFFVVMSNIFIKFILIKLYINVLIITINNYNKL